MFLLLAGFLAALIAGRILLVAASDLPDVGFLSRHDAVIPLTVTDWEGNPDVFYLGPINPSWTPLEQIPPHLRNAVLAGEDFSFYSHRGVDWFEVRQSIIKDIREWRFVRGASTITQQLAKNLFLSREKTLSRKLRELFLARRLEKTLKKDRILELYLNLVELGDGVYGVEEGARHHFGKEPMGLSLRESSMLAAMLPGPKVYDPEHNFNKVLERSDHILRVMLKGRMITDEQYQAALAQAPYPGETQPPDELFNFAGIEAINTPGDWGTDISASADDEGKQVDTLLDGDVSYTQMDTVETSIGLPDVDSGGPSHDQLFEIPSPETHEELEGDTSLENGSPYMEEGIVEIPIGTPGERSDR